MRLADSIELFERRTFDQSLDNVCEVWVDVSGQRAVYTLVLDNDLNSYKQSLIVQRFRRIFCQDPVDIRYKAKRTFKRRYTSYKIFPK